MSNGLGLKRPPRSKAENLAAMEAWTQEPASQAVSAIQASTAIHSAEAIQDGNAIQDEAALQARIALQDSAAIQATPKEIHNPERGTVARAGGADRKTKSSNVARKWGGASQSRTYRIPEELHVALRGLAGTTIGMSITDLVIIAMSNEVETRMKERGLKKVPEEWWLQ